MEISDWETISSETNNTIANFRYAKVHGYLCCCGNIHCKIRVSWFCNQPKWYLNAPIERISYFFFQINQSRALHQIQSVEDFDRQVKDAGNKLVVIDFFATWLQPSKHMGQYLESYSREYAEKIVVLQVNLDQFEKLAKEKYGIDSMPTFVFLKNGKMVEKFSADNPATIAKTIIHLTNPSKKRVRFDATQNKITHF